MHSIPVLQVEFFPSPTANDTPSIGGAFMQSVPRVGEYIYLQTNWGRPAADQKLYKVISISWIAKDVTTLDSTIHDKVSDSVRVYVEEVK